MVDYSQLRILNLKETKEKIRTSVTNDILIIQTTHTLKELEKAIDFLTKTLREWYSYYLPEISNLITDPEKFINEIIKSTKQALIKKYEIKDSIGAELKKEDLQPILNYALQIKNLQELKKQQLTYLEVLMEQTAPNLSETATPLIGAQLISIAGSLKQLANFPSSTIQLLGAEKALFRHLIKKSKPPKYGILYNHPKVAQAKQKEKGKVARKLAAQITIAARKDYFRK